MLMIILLVGGIPLEWELGIAVRALVLVAGADLADTLVVEQ